jgi:hypothetical protein
MGTTAPKVKLFCSSRRAHAESQRRTMRLRLSAERVKDGAAIGMESVSRRNVLGLGATTLAAAALGAMSLLAAAAPASAQSATTTATTTAATTARRGRGGTGFGRGFAGGDLQAVATALKLTLAQLRQQHQAGKSIAQIFQAQNVPLQTVKDAIIAAAKSRLDAAVTAGRLTSAQETQQLTTLQADLDQFLNRTPGQLRGTAPGRSPRAGRHLTGTRAPRQTAAQS